MFGSVANVIIDNGTHSLKIGSSNQPRPELILPSVFRSVNPITKILDTSAPSGLGIEFGTNVFDSLDEKTRVEPLIHAGEVTRVKELFHIYSEVFLRQFTLEPSSTVFFFCESLRASEQESLKPALFERFFEEIGAEVMGSAPQVVLDLFSVGLTSGTVVDSGHGSTQIAPVVEGYVLRGQRKVERLSGSTVNQLISAETALRAVERKDNRLFDGLKRALCAWESGEPDFHSDPETRQQTAKGLFTCPDGTNLELAEVSNRFNSVFFDKSQGLASSLVACLDSMIYKRIEDLLISNVLLTGGNSRAFRFAETLESQLRESRLKYLSPGFRVRSVEREPELSAWRGGCVVTALPSSTAYFITRSEFEEKGARIFKQYNSVLDF